jgi:hypothetical protein
MQVAVCVERQGARCTPLTNTHFVRRCSLGASFGLSGLSPSAPFVRVAEKRLGTRHPLEPAYAVTSPMSGSVWPKDSSTAVAMLGPVGTYIDPADECGPPAPGRGVITKDGRSHAECQGGCLMEFIVSSQGRHLSIRRRLAPRDPLTVAPMSTLNFSSSSIESRLGTGVVKYVLLLDGKAVAKRLISLSRSSP